MHIDSVAKIPPRFVGVLDFRSLEKISIYKAFEFPWLLAICKEVSAITKTDCLLIGNNQMSFHEYIKNIEKMGEQAGAFRDVNLHYIKSQGRNISMRDVYNKKHLLEETPIKTDDILSATIAYLGTFLHKHGHSFAYVNSFQEGKKEIADLLINSKVISIAITTTYYVSVLPILEIMDFIRSCNNKSKIIVGGPFVTTQMKIMDRISTKYLFQQIGADFYINSSQGEAALSDIINAIKKRRDTTNIKNIIYKSENSYIENEIEPEDNILEENPVDWDLFRDSKRSMISVRTAISCPYACAFCSFPEHAGKFSYITPMRLCNELNQIHLLPHITSVNFLDDTFNVPVNRFKEILKLMAKKNFRFRWNGHFRCQYADRETVELMKESGCEGVFLGIESGSQEILNNMNKKSTIDNYYRGLDLLKEYQIITYASFIIGFPGETDTTVQQTIGFLESAQPDFYRAQLWYYDTTTPVSLSTKHFGLKNSQFEWEHHTMNSMEAADWVDYIFLNVRNSVWLPQNDFDYPGLFNLLNRGWAVDDIKYMIQEFNNLIAEKIKRQNQNLNSLENLVNKSGIDGSFSF